MHPLSATASIIATLQLSSKVLAYLNDVKDASKDRAHCAIEVSNLYSLLVNLRFRLEREGLISRGTPLSEPSQSRMGRSTNSSKHWNCCGLR
jgi:hypothetical protein